MRALPPGPGWSEKRRRGLRAFFAKMKGSGRTAKLFGGAVAYTAGKKTIGGIKYAEGAVNTGAEKLFRGYLNYRSKAWQTIDATKFPPKVKRIAFHGAKIAPVAAATVAIAIPISRAVRRVTTDRGYTAAERRQRRGSFKNRVSDTAIEAVTSVPPLVLAASPNILAQQAAGRLLPLALQGRSAVNKRRNKRLFVHPIVRKESIRRAKVMKLSNKDVK